MVNLSTNGADLERAYQAVLSGDPNTVWALFGYAKKSVDLKVIETSGNLSLLLFLLKNQREIWLNWPISLMMGRFSMPLLESWIPTPNCPSLS